jgi:hypothetical protein
MTPLLPLLSRPLPRRTFLRGAGAAMALPFLEAMMGPARAQSTSTTPLRLFHYYVPCGMHMADFTPRSTGAMADVRLPRMLAPLESVKARLQVLSGVQCTAAFDQGDGPGGHARGTSSFLTSTHPQKSETQVQNAISVDQVAANAWRGQTVLPSLQLGCEAGDGAGVCDIGYSCAYAHNISWSGPKTPLPKDTNPQTVFDRLFNQTDLTLSPEQKAAKRRRRTSVLDFVKDDAQQLSRRLGQGDRARMDEYLTGVRELEARVAATAEQQCAIPEAPGGAIVDTTAYLDTMLDLVVAAYRCDLVRTVTFMVGNAGSNRSYAFLGHPSSHHEYSHHQGKEEKLSALADIGRFEVARLARFAEQLAAIDEGGENLLSRSALVLGSELSDGDRHNHDELPLLVLGGLGGALKGGQHVRMPAGTELGDVHLTLLRAAGVDVGTFGEDGRRVLSELLA